MATHAARPSGGNSGRSGTERASSLRAQRSSTGSANAVKSPESTRPLALDQFGAVVLQGPKMVPSPGYAELPPTRFPGTAFQVSCLQHMGDRRTQEDRYLMVPRLEPDSTDTSPLALFCVFDGTVGDFASDNIKDIFLPTMLQSQSWRDLRAGKGGTVNQGMLENVFRETYPAADKALLEKCSRNQQHYATCTSVTMMLMGDLLMVGHLGDSRIVLGVERNGEMCGEEVTKDHKPDLDEERKRIEECGGMVERLLNHNNKPFIRGGDFMMRKALGEQPMQLQYSRAFGGKDLKVFGLSNHPDVTVLRRGKEVRWAIIASDGLWDVVSAKMAVQICEQTAQTDSTQHNPSAALVRHALMEQSRRKARADNITAVCIQFDQ